jgi:hypothetical protein
MATPATRSPNTTNNPVRRCRTPALSGVTLNRARLKAPPCSDPLIESSSLAPARAPTPLFTNADRPQGPLRTWGAMQPAAVPGGAPQWLRGLVSDEFFDACAAHPGERKNDKNHYCVDCAAALCRQCLPHDPAHDVLQVTPGRAYPVPPAALISSEPRGRL